MPEINTPVEEKLKALCDKWNTDNPPGTMVIYEDFIGMGETHRGTTLDSAMVVGGHSVVVRIQGLNGYADVQHCKRV